MYQHILVTNHQCHRWQGHVTCSADYLLVDTQGGTSLLHRVSFRFAWEGDFSPVGGEAYLTVGLFPAMRLGLPLVSDQPVAPGFEESFSRLQDIILAWFPGNNLTKVGVEAPLRTLVSNHPRRRTFALFSGGVDSFHTIHRHRSEIQHLLYIDGFDTDLYQTSYRATVRSSLETAASALGLPLLTVETDARLFLDKYVKWGLCATTVSGAVIQLLHTHCAKIYIGGSHLWNATHVLADGYPLPQQYELADLELVVDSLDCTRHDKVAALADCTTALQHLRVCWEMPGSNLNCGRCEKCLRTMVALDAAGILDRCPTFPTKIDWDQIATFDLSHIRQIKLWAPTAEAATEEISWRRLDHIVRRARTRHHTFQLWEAGKNLSSARNWPVLARKLGKPLLAAMAGSDPDWLEKKAGQQMPALRELLWATLAKRHPSLLARVWRALTKRSATDPSRHTAPPQ